MKPITAVSLLATLVTARPKPRQECDSTKPPAFLLAGDSTVAVDGGWGDGFLTYPREGAIGTNFAKGGATTVSFVAGGYWASLTSELQERVSEYDVYVTIQVSNNVEAMPA